MSEGLPFDPIAEAHRQWVEHGWGDAADGMAAITSLMRAHQIAVSRAEAVVRPFGITFARYETLMLLHFSSRGSLPMSVLGSRLQVHQTSVTNAVDRLEAAGLVVRRPHPDDRRSTLVEITPEGRELAEKVTAELNAKVFTDPGLSPSAMTRLVGVLRAYRKEAGDF
ncbi:MAG TPA: MarR family transcriptional regulator [Candidatus Nanopelagicales bacterium]|nr:MarR family transcriptional regulator [Candidatus Nanopelagicales bacterium]